jgi:hypothetical protein
MSLAADDEFLGAIAQQARVAYATQQLDACRTALQSWQAEAAFEVGAPDDPRVRHELAYYTSQVERWQEYLRCLGQGLHQVGAAQELIRLDALQGS